MAEALTLQPQLGMEVAHEAQPAVEAVSQGMIAGMRERAAERFANVNKFIKRGGAVMLGALAIGEGVQAIAPATAEASTTATTMNQSGSTLTDMNTSLRFHVAGSSMSEKSFAHIRVLGNHRVVSKAKIHKLEQQGKCHVFDGKKTPIWTQGHDESGYPYGKDTRTSEFCKDGRGWYRALCGNRASIKVRPKHVVNGAIKWVQDFNKISLRISAKSKAKAEAECKTADGLASAHAYGSGEGSASATLRLSTAMKAKGKIKEIITRNKAKAEGTASSSAKATAVAICEQGEKTPPPPVVVQKTKDSTQTPQPPVEAPDPNPAPSPEEPFPGGYQCYDEVTGAPVTPRTDRTCPAGSYGA